MSGRSLFSRSSARRRVRTHDGPSAIAPSPSSPPCEEWGISRALSISLDGAVPFLDVKRSRSYDAMIVNRSCRSRYTVVIAARGLGGLCLAHGAGAWLRRIHLGQLEVAIVLLVDVIRGSRIRRRSADARHTPSRPNAYHG